MNLDSYYELNERALNECLADFDGMTPLMIACQNQSIECARLLLDRGADINIRHRRCGYTALHLACKSTERHSEDLITLLLRRSANIGIKDVHQQTPLHLYALCKYGKSVEIMDSLIPGANLASLASQTDQGNTVLSLLCDSLNNDFFNRSCRFLLQKGAKVTDTNWRDETILHKVAKRFDCDDELEHIIVKKYVTGNGMIDALDNLGWSPLHHAVYNGKWHLVELLLKEGANPLLDPFHRSNGRSYSFPETDRTQKCIVARDPEKFMYEDSNSMQLVVGTHSVCKYFELVLRYHNPCKIFDSKIQRMSQNVMSAVGDRMVDTRQLREKIKSLEEENGTLRQQNKAFLMANKELQETIAEHEDRQLTCVGSTQVGTVMQSNTEGPNNKRRAETDPPTTIVGRKVTKRVEQPMVPSKGLDTNSNKKLSGHGING